MRYVENKFYRAVGLLAIAAAAAVSASAEAAFYTWTGVSSSDWVNTANWTPAGPPGATDVAVFPADTASTSVLISSAAEVFFLQFGEAASYTFTVQNALTVSGMFPTAVNFQMLPQHFEVTTGTLWFKDGSLRNSQIVNQGTVILEGSSFEDAPATIVNAGTLLVRNYAAGQFLTVTQLAGTIDASQASVGVSFGSLSTSGASPGSIVLGSNVLSVGYLNNNDEIAANISGVFGSVDKAGTGTLRLSGQNTYTNSTEVRKGTLRIDGTQANIFVRVYSGARLTGSGNAGPVVGQAGSLLIPGDATHPTLGMTRLTCYASTTAELRLAPPAQSSYLTLGESLTASQCPKLNFKLVDAVAPPVVGQEYLLAEIRGETDYTTANVNIDFSRFAGYEGTVGTVLFDVSPGNSTIKLRIDALNDRIFRDGSEPPLP